MTPPALGDRALFPDLRPWAYLNHCGISPASRAVQQAAAEVAQSYAEVGSNAVPRWLAQRARLKDKLAHLIGARAADLALVPSTTRGIIDLALCMPWRAGDRILCFEGEFPTNVTPWQAAARTFGLQVDLLPLDGFGDGSGQGLQRVEDALKQGARLVAVSAAQFQTGLRMPILALADLAHRYGAEIFVDAIQAVGVVPLQDLAPRIDYLSCGSHKWLMGLEGCGFVYVHPDRVTALRPTIAGWLSHTDALAFLFEGAGHLRYDRPIRARADFLEVGATNVLGFAALEAAIDPILTLGVPAIYAHVQRYLDGLEQGCEALGFASLRAADPQARSGILSLRPPPDADLPALVRGLSARGVVAAMPDGHLRFGPHWPNALDEVPRVLGALAEARQDRAL